ncbi:hypothetical protein AK812_SmicGene48678, partial [Symbiodinium microadriaticum]
ASIDATNSEKNCFFLGAFAHNLQPIALVGTDLYLMRALVAVGTLLSWRSSHNPNDVLEKDKDDQRMLDIRREKTYDARSWNLALLNVQALQ